MVTILQGEGFDPQVARHATKRHGFLAGTDRERLTDFNQALRSKRIRAIICIRGGYGTGRIINRIDFAALRMSPKILIGCSDITALLSGALRYAKIVSFHGPMPQSLVEPECPLFTKKHMLDALTGSDQALGSINRDYPEAATTIDVIRTGKVTAKLVGGNLAVLTSLVGTPFFPDLSESVLFLEDIGETPFRIDRYLTQLLNVGALEKVAGFALGLFKDCDYRPPKPGDRIEYRQSLRDVIIDRLAPLGRPIVMGLPFGHMPYNATLGVGSLVTLDARRGDLVIEESGVVRS